jgi:hypothetical protein
LDYVVFNSAMAVISQQPPFLFLGSGLNPYTFMRSVLSQLRVLTDSSFDAVWVAAAGSFMIACCVFFLAIMTLDGACAWSVAIIIQHATKINSFFMVERFGVTM